MKSVMISIKPKWCELIASGDKTVEVRKTRPKIDTPFKCYIYETQGKTEVPTFIDEEGHEIYRGKGKVIGEFVCDNIFMIWDGYVGNLGDDCLTFEERENYLKGNNGYGWHISDLVIYDKPKNLEEFIPYCKFLNDDCTCQFEKVECECAKTIFNPDYSLNMVKCLNYMTRPPQSYCYVEEI